VPAVFPWEGKADLASVGAELVDVGSLTSAGVVQSPRSGPESGSYRLGQTASYLAWSCRDCQWRGRMVVAASVDHQRGPRTQPRLVFVGSGCYPPLLLDTVYLVVEL
jgi:hypothetical protein